MELLGKSLEQLFKDQNKHFTLKTTCMLGIQMVDRLEYLHSCRIIHRDVKPDNFCMGIGDKSHIVYIIDFGLSKKYWNRSIQSHIPLITGKSLTGTARYASINALDGYEQSRRDDLESLGYILVYFLNGSLPWQGLKVSSKHERFKKILELKKQISVKELCKGFPKEIEDFITYTRKLKFMEVPDYNYLRNLLRNAIKEYGSVIDFHYDWLNQKPDIKADDPIYTNDYGIKYNFTEDWLCPFIPYDPESEEKASKNEIFKTKKEIENAIKKYTTNSSYTDALQSTVPAFRADRELLAVRADHSSFIKGIVHEVSSSGLTLYIEPEEIIRLNNDLIQKEAKLESELKKIFTELTEDLGKYKENLLEAHKKILFLDQCFAAASWQKKVNGIFAEDCDTKEEPPLLLQARHPLLEIGRASCRERV